MDGERSFRLTRRYDAAPAEVWAALTEDESVERWLGRPLGTIVHADPPRVLELDWSSEREPHARVRFELVARDGGTLLVLAHTGIGASVGMQTLQWWTRRLECFEVAA